MRFHRKTDQPPPSGTASEAGDYSSRLHDLAPIHPDDDGRPTGEDLHTYDMTPEGYVQQVDTPNWLRKHRHPHRERSGDQEPDPPSEPQG
ncbi:hypothetical protein EKO23_11065 [Nocardioides guangzhouensis]|uniref:Uncharacterized protein n=1 Tax=Nocardioides guangzhouensis TaxID=2497878 RepID=A0A4Q4ZEM6_9ACTN|nr:hypothetical protein [Nocardioides guangzhouensis]RYP85846.1 hypothetical protein EKO23_11065 [Nocardioides guangzhouensis]